MNSRNKEFAIAFFLYLSGSLLVLIYALWYVNNPDTFQYIALARKYLAGDFTHALNGYWSPLLSWLLILPLSLGIGNILALKILQISIGGFALFAWSRLVHKSGLEGFYRIAVILIAIPFIIDYAILNPTADLLFLTLVLFYLNLLVDIEWLKTTRSAILTGVVGSLLYFAKAFGFPFFISSMIIAVVYNYFYFRGNYIGKYFFSAILVFVCLSSFWIAALSCKYGSFTAYKVLGFNLTKEVAPLPGVTMHLPVLSQGLIAPLDDHACSAWESPGDVVHLTPLHPFLSSADFNYYLQVIKRNLMTIYYFDFRRQIGTMFIILALLFIVTSGLKIFFQNRFLFLLLITWLIFYAGYSLVLVHTRYIWINTWLMLLLGAVFLQYIFKTGLMKKASYFMLVIMLLVAVKRPVKEILFSEDKDVPLLWIGKGITHPLETMRIIYRPDRLLHDLAYSLRKSRLINGAVASLRNDSPIRHYYSSSLFLTSYSRVPYYGQVSDTISFEEQLRQLNEQKIRYFFTWGPDGWPGAASVNIQPVIKNPESGLMIYKLW